MERMKGWCRKIKRDEGGDKYERRVSKFHFDNIDVHVSDFVFDDFVPTDGVTRI